MREDGQAHELQRQFVRFATVAERSSPLYGTICRAVAGDPELLALAACAPPAQRRPNLLLAAVHYLLLEGAEHPLARCYRSVAEWRGGPETPPDRTGAASDGVSEGPPPDPTPVPGLFADFCAAHHDALAEVLGSRATQTNEVGRCAALLPALSAVAASAGRPLGVVDLGASAGLNLLFDRYVYRYRPGGTAGTPGSAVTIDCEVRAGAPLPAPLPALTARLGLDERPLDPTDPDDACWLLACQWPDEVGRFRRLRDALSVAASEPDRAVVRRGDIVDDLAEAAAQVPEDAHLCLLHTWVAAYLDPARQAALAQAVTDVARSRPLSWLFAEQPAEVPGLTVPPPPGGRQPSEATALVLTQLGGPAPGARRLADLHPHGRWLRWYG